MMFLESEMLVLKQNLAIYNEVALITHKDPDGDAIGSALAWCNVLQNAGHQVSVITPNEVPGNLRWMLLNHLIIEHDKNSYQAIEKIEKAGLILYLDFNSLSRTGNLAEKLNASKAVKVMIDHHPFPENEIADVIISNTLVSSTCELSYFVMNFLGISINRKIAECLYAGIVSDTGMLGHNSSNPDLYRTVASLLEAGVDKNAVHQRLFHNYSLNRTRLFGHALCNKLEVLPSGKAALISLSNIELDSFGALPGDLEGLVNFPLSIEGIEVSALVTERHNGYVKLSFRSNGQIPVNKYSGCYFSGGGHDNAAGGQYSGALVDAVKLFKETVEHFFGWEARCF